MKTTLETNKLIKKIEIISIIVFLALAICCFINCWVKTNKAPESYSYQGTIQMIRDRDYEDYDENNKVCAVRYYLDEDEMIVSYSYQEYQELTDDYLVCHKYQADDYNLFFKDKVTSDMQIEKAYKLKTANDLIPLLNLAYSLLILSLAIYIVLRFSNHFTTYEKTWFISIMILATIFSIIFPEETTNGVYGAIIMLLYLLDTFLNILCELLISKQSRYNFLVSVLVEIVEIVTCIILMYRFATMAVTLFFWLPIDIASFVNWSRHKDEEKDELTKVRKLKGYQEVLVIVGIILWTIIFGYLISGLDIATDFFKGNQTIETIVAYLDACASALGIANGLFIFFRLQEQWIAWYLSALIESIINIVSGQYVLLVLKLGYFTNTTYGYLKWNRYIKEHGKTNSSFF